MSKIAVVGSINMDLVTVAAQRPRPGETLHGETFNTIPGGKGANQAVAAARLGATVTMLGCVGGDVFGSECINNFRSENVETGYIKRVTGISTGIASITVSGGENSIIIVAGANEYVSAEYVLAHENVIAGSEAVMLQLEVPMLTVIEAARIGQKYNKKVFLNPSPICTLPDELIDMTDFIIANEHEAAQFSTCRSKLVITRGENGVSFYEKNIEKHIPAHNVAVIDTTGAGDTFFAAFTVRILQNASPEHACEFANAASAISVSKLGAQGAMPGFNEVNSLMSKVRSLC